MGASQTNAGAGALRIALVGSLLLAGAASLWLPAGPTELSLDGAAFALIAAGLAAAAGTRALRWTVAVVAAVGALIWTVTDAVTVGFGATLAALMVLLVVFGRAAEQRAAPPARFGSAAVLGLAVALGASRIGLDLSDALGTRLDVAMVAGAAAALARPPSVRLAAIAAFAGALAGPIARAVLDIAGLDPSLAFDAYGGALFGDLSAEARMFRSPLGALPLALGLVALVCVRRGAGAAGIFWGAAAVIVGVGFGGVGGRAGELAENLWRSAIDAGAFLFERPAFALAPPIDLEMIVIADRRAPLHWPVGGDTFCLLAGAWALAVASQRRPAPRVNPWIILAACLGLAIAARAGSAWAGLEPGWGHAVAPLPWVGALLVLALAAAPARVAAMGGRARPPSVPVVRPAVHTGASGRPRRLAWSQFWSEKRDIARNPALAARKIADPQFSPLAFKLTETVYAGLLATLIGVVASGIAIIGTLMDFGFDRVGIANALHTGVVGGVGAVIGGFALPIAFLGIAAVASWPLSVGRRPTAARGAGRQLYLTLDGAFGFWPQAVVASGFAIITQGLGMAGNGSSDWAYTAGQALLWTGGIIAAPGAVVLFYLNAIRIPLTVARLLGRTPWWETTLRLVGHYLTVAFAAQIYSLLVVGANLALQWTSATAIAAAFGLST